MKQLILLTLVLFAFIDAKSQYLNEVIFETANQDSTFTLIGYNEVISEYDFMAIASKWTVGTISMDQPQKGGYQLLPVQTKEESGGLLFGCVLIHSSSIDIDELSMSSLGFYKMNSLEDCLAVSAFPKSMSGVLGKKDAFLALINQLFIQKRINRDEDFNHLSSMFKDAAKKHFVFDSDLFSNEQIDEKNAVVDLPQISTQVHYYSKESKNLDADYYTYPMALPKSLGGGTFFCVYSRETASFYVEPLLSFKGSAGALSNQQLSSFERAILKPKAVNNLLGK